MNSIDSSPATGGALAQDRPSRRQMLGTLAAASAATLVDPGEVLARFAADVACVAGGPAGELLGTLPLFRNRVVPGLFGVKYDGTGLDARLDTDLSLLAPDKLITPNELAYIRTEIPAAAANHQGPWTLDASGLLATPTGRSSRISPAFQSRWAHISLSVRETAAIAASA